MENKAISPAALVSLKDALSKIYWYKRELRNFLEYAIVNKQIVSTIDWNNNTKYESASQLIDRMNDRLDIYFEDLLSLLKVTIAFNDFSHFDIMEMRDKEKHKKDALSAISALRAHCKGYFEAEEDRRKTEKAKEEFKISQQNTRDFNDKMDEFKDRYYGIARLENAQKRGYELEAFLNDLFYFFDLSPRSSFKNSGEQIDGAFTHDDSDYLLEAKWQVALVQRSDIDAFEMKISRKLKTTLGLFFATNGFVDSVLNSEIRFASIILMDSQDLIQVLDNRISLNDLIRRKRRHASETGNNMYRVNV